MYVSEEGNFEIYVDNTFYGNFGPGVAFGELALLYNTKRMSSIDGIVAQLNDKTTFFNYRYFLFKTLLHVFLFFSHVFLFFGEKKQNY